MASKITIIGGGSSTFVPQLMRLFVESRPLAGSTIALMDVDARRLEVMDRLCRLLVDRLGADLTIESTTDRRESLVGADHVITAISVGGMDAWEMDIEIPARYGLYMPTA
ncbi:MAG: alpha-glucosidase/alpha-galactosidase, partial [Chloroflexi bacterium]|nr:alpha-glucosidase/alpha-galactosidase [Chloroflexota bacterium]